jgi:hypothetical protein
MLILGLHVHVYVGHNVKTYILGPQYIQKIL